MEEDIIYNDMIRIETASDEEQNNIIKLAETMLTPKPKKQPTVQNPFADFDFGED